jgi:hypothetical protein
MVVSTRCDAVDRSVDALFAVASHPSVGTKTRMAKIVTMTTSTLGARLLGRKRRTPVDFSELPAYFDCRERKCEWG